MNRSVVRLLIIFLLLLTVAGAGLYVYVQYHLEQPVVLAQQAGEPKRLWTISRGSNLSQVNRKLHAEGILSGPKLMARYAKFSGRASIQAGSYWIEPGDNIKSLLSGDFFMN